VRDIAQFRSPLLVLCLGYYSDPNPHFDSHREGFEIRVHQLKGLGSTSFILWESSIGHFSKSTSRANTILGRKVNLQKAVKSGSTPVGGPVKSRRKRTKDKGRGLDKELVRPELVTAWIQRLRTTSVDPLRRFWSRGTETETETGRNWSSDYG